MHHQDKRARDLARLEETRRRVQQRMVAEQARIDKRFDRLRQRLGQQYGEASDSQQRIIDASLKLLQEDGLSNITLRKLASMLDMQAPALYWHFKNKEVLVDYMAEAILEKEFKDIQPRHDDETWQDWLTSQMLRLRKAMLAYPDGARVVAGAHLYPAVTLGNLFETVLLSLEATGLNIQTARHILMTATTYTFGFVIEEQASPNAEEIEMLKQQAQGDLYPHMTRAMQEAHRVHRDLDHDYRIGLAYIIAGASSKD